MPYMDYGSKKLGSFMTDCLSKRVNALEKQAYPNVWRKLPDSERTPKRNYPQPLWTDNVITYEVGKA